ncbi:ABC1-domain-containing protein [Polyporus arcularius HHB13444]|uniref:ABC1-domain-containing protein n=1 Tax=Polyporus arcularius HHB13444 TaxID=1314778 RepID=A0A5C3P5M8_9APHY|nr:ABC1-domain-containing protein [Polyporus arcularius HHB13444]
MPPGPAYNWLCVAHSLCDILGHAAHIRAAQLARTGRAGPEQLSRKRKRDEPPAEQPVAKPSAVSKAASPDVVRPPEVTPVVLPPSPAPAPSVPADATPAASVVVDIRPPALPAQAFQKKPEPEVPSVGDVSASTSIPDPGESIILDSPRARNLQSSKVPSSRIGRLFHYGGLAASLGYGAASELLRRSTHSSDENSTGSLMLTEGNIKRLVSKLTQMRGAALKLGQFMSIQDSHVLPPEIEDIFRRVQDSAHYMPDWQMEQVMRDSLGPSWMDNFESFDRLPFAAASIGQVHSAVLKAAVSPTGEPARVAVKVQFPNIVNSINSDLGYVKMLLTASKLLPPGLFLDRTISVMKDELAEECDYAREASFLRRFGREDHLGGDERFKVPWVWEGSTDRVLVMEHVGGVSVGGSVISKLSQRDRDDIAARIIDLCLRELFVFRAMQTDPNWTNFLWNQRTRRVELVDFGATREYSKEFIDNWLHLLSAAVAEDRDACVEWSLKLGYLTGQENDVMLDAHVRSMVLLGTPFNASTPQPFTFGPKSKWAEITAEIRAQIPVMLQHRLTPPPRETYSLNRKLSGAFLLASRLNASVDCRTLWTKVVEGYRFG